MIKAILIDDEVHCLDTLSMLMSEYFPEIDIIDKCTSGRKALESVQKTKPDLVFLDIEMPIMNGFEFLEQFDPIPFSVIFTTSYDQYAIKAIRFSALDYLLKPIIPKELATAVNRVKAQKKPPSGEQFHMLMRQIQHKETGFAKIALPTADGFELIPADQLVRCEADDNYTHVYLKNKNKITVCRTLKEVEMQLEDFSSFIRVHNSTLVNLNEVTKYVRGEGGYLIMNDGSTVTVSRSRKDLLLRKFKSDKE